MLRDGEIAADDAKRVLRRFWWIVAITVFIGGAIGMGAATMLPKKYTSQTLILVQQPGVPSDIVRPVITEDLNRRLASMQEQILSRTRLQPIIEKLGLYSELRGKVPSDDAVELLRSSIVVTPLESMPGTQHQGLPGFSVKVTFSEPRLAQQICTDITSMFMEQNELASEQQAKRTTSFLQQELGEAKAKLDEQDAKLAQFKRKNLGILPEELQANLSLLTGMNSQLEANTQSLARAQQDKALNESMLSDQLATWEASQNASGRSPETLEQQLSAMQDQLAMLQTRYTTQHPDVIKLKHSIEEMKRRIKETPKADVPASETAQTLKKEPQQIQQLRANLRQNELNIEELTKRQVQIQKQIGVLQARVEESPIVEQQLKELTRNHQSALDFYNELLKELNHSTMTSDLQQQQEGEHFSVLDPPSLPNQPSFPKKLNFAGGGLGAGFALGMGILALILISDQAIYTERDVELCLKLPVLGLIPDMGVKSAGTNNALAEDSYAPVGTRI